MFGDGGDVVPLHLSVGGIMLSQQHLDGGLGVAVGAVRRSEHVLAGHQGASAPRRLLSGVDQCRLPGVLLGLGLYSTNNSRLSSSNAAVAV